MTIGGGEGTEALSAAPIVEQGPGTVRIASGG